MKSTSWAIDRIREAKYNPRDIRDESFAALKVGIKKFGLIQPLIVNVRDGHDILVSGHQRLKAARDLGMSKVEVVTVDLSENDEKILNLAMNNPNAQGYFTDAIYNLVSELSDFEPDILGELALNNFVMPDWDNKSGFNSVVSNLDGIECTIKINCQMAEKDSVLDVLKPALEQFKSVRID